MKMRKILLITLLLLASLPAAAQVRLGLRGGITVGELRFDRDFIDSDNRVGYTGGLLIDVNIPVVGLGVEASAMYTRRNNRLTDHDRVYKRHYFEFPVYARYRLALPKVERVFVPYVYTGPNFAVLFNDDNYSAYEGSKTYLSWDVGAGADLFRHLRVSATYGIGMTKAMSYIDREYSGDRLDGKDRHWTINVAWLF